MDKSLERSLNKALSDRQGWAQTIWGAERDPVVRQEVHRRAGNPPTMVTQVNVLSDRWKHKGFAG